MVGRLRPNFLSLCDPVVPNPVTVSYGQPASANPACTAPESSELTDAHYRCAGGLVVRRFGCCRLRVGTVQRSQLPRCWFTGLCCTCCTCRTAPSTCPLHQASCCSLCTGRRTTPFLCPLTRITRSFPSGHASSAFVLSVWVCIYCLWVLNARQPRRTAKALAAMSLRERLAHSLGAAAGLFW